MKNSITDQIRQYSSVQNLVRKKQIQNDLGMTKNQVKSAVETLCIQGALKRIGHGLYEFREPKTRQKNIVEDKIWRALRINPVFSASDIALQAGSTTSYIYKRLRCYFAEKLIKPSGRKQTVGGNHEKLWRLTAKGRAFIKRPATYREYQPEPIIEETVNLNRLVCSGRVVSDDNSRMEAIRLCLSIANRLQKETTNKEE